jgi:hypothetical protein
MWIMTAANSRFTQQLRLQRLGQATKFREIPDRSR